MGLGTTRKVLSVICAVIIAIGTVCMLSGIILRMTFSSDSFLKKYSVDESLVSECTEQLDMKYKTLEAETGIPFRVFEAVKTDFPVDRSITTAFENAFGAEDAALYSRNMVNYFNNNITEYLDGSGINYNASDVENAAEEAAQIFSDTLGLHGVGTVSRRANEISRRAASVSGIAALAIALGAFLAISLFNDRRKGLEYILSGAAGGTLASAAGSVICALSNVGSKITVSPAAYQQSVNGAVRFHFLILAAVSAVAAVILYIALIALIRMVNKKSRRSLTI